MVDYIDGAAFKNILRKTVVSLQDKREMLNQINTFPVPDGDTGNNLLATLESALQEAESVPDDSISIVSEASYRGAREGSTGNSGAIFAQYLKGMHAAWKGVAHAGCEETQKAFSSGAEYAYAAVQNPKEGTILTVAREAADAAYKTSEEKNLSDMLLALYLQARNTLNNTTDMLPELREHGMIDAGGWGLLIFFASILEVLQIPKGISEFSFKPKRNYFQSRRSYEFTTPFDMEFIIESKEQIESAIREELKNHGEELITQANEHTSHVHIHTHDPLCIAEKTAWLAPIQDMIIRDMRCQYDAMTSLSDKNVKTYTTIVFSASPGFLAMAALAGAHIAATSRRLEKKTRLLQEPCSQNALLISSEPITLPFAHEPIIQVEGEVPMLASLVSIFSREKPAPETVLYAAGYPRTAAIEPVQEAFKAVIGSTVVSGGDLFECIIGAVSQLGPQSGEVLTIYYGHPDKREKIQKLIPHLESKFPSLDQVDIFYGGQETPYLLSIE